MNRSAYEFWLVVRPAADVPGQWVAHCLELDVVTSGNSIRHAFEMAAEASLMTVLDDVAEHGAPRADRRAPDEYWEQLKVIFRRGVFGEKLEDADPQDIEAVAAQLRIEVLCPQPVRQSRPPEQTWDLPLFWRQDHRPSEAHAS
jgi:hypothetical protein